MDAKTPIMETNNLTKIYIRKGKAPVKALDGINLTVHQGEFLAIVGRSGSGKTTLLNLLGTLDQSTSGFIKFQGKNLAALSKNQLTILRREKIGFIFQTFNLLPSLTVRENVESALIHSPLSKNQIRLKVEAKLDLLELAEMSDRLPLELSVGQQQKAAIARATVKDPTLILADEPTGEVDPITGKEILQKIIEMKSILETTLVVATHGTALLSEADRAIFVKAGQIVSEKDAGY